jgi:hypothetical protein
MKITKSRLRKLINEVTQGEMEFQELEDARRAYIEDRNDDTRHELGLMVNKLVEPILAKMGFFWQAEAYYSGGKIVFESFDPRIDITIDPAGMMGRYDVGIYPMDEELKFKPIEMSQDTMKGALQFISDTLGETGMVGEPEAQTELPLGKGGISRLPKWRRETREHKMKITKSQLQKIIKEEAAKALREDASDDTFEMVDVIVQALGPQQALEELVQAMERSNAQDLLSYVMRMHDIGSPGDEVEDYDPSDF